MRHQASRQDGQAQTVCQEGASGHALLGRGRWGRRTDLAHGHMEVTHGRPSQRQLGWPHLALEPPGKQDGHCRGSRPTHMRGSETLHTVGRAGGALWGLQGTPAHTPGSGPASRRVVQEGPSLAPPGEQEKVLVLAGPAPVVRRTASSQEGQPHGVETVFRADLKANESQEQARVRPGRQKGRTGQRVGCSAHTGLQPAPASAGAETALGVAVGICVVLWEATCTRGKGGVCTGPGPGTRRRSQRPPPASCQQWLCWTRGCSGRQGSRAKAQVSSAWKQRPEQARPPLWMDLQEFVSSSYGPEIRGMGGGRACAHLC